MSAESAIPVIYKVEGGESMCWAFLSCRQSARLVQAILFQNKDGKGRGMVKRRALGCTASQRAVLGSGSLLLTRKANEIER